MLIYKSNYVCNPVDICKDTGLPLDDVEYDLGKLIKDAGGKFEVKTLNKVH